MPGENSAFDPSRYKWYNLLWSTNVHIFCIIGITILQTWGLIRFYYIWDDLRFTAESFIMTSLCAAFSYLAFTALWRCKNADPGYLIPDLKGKDKPDEKFEGETCSRCDLKRSHDKIHHCHRCNRCVDYMDHHCLFTDNCIGKKNSRHFFAFIFWANLGMIIALLMML